MLRKFLCPPGIVASYLTGDAGRFVAARENLQVILGVLDHACDQLAGDAADVAAVHQRLVLLLESLTPADFARALRESKRPDGSALDTMYMPVRFTKNLNDTEVQALYAFLKTLPPKPYGGR